MGRDRRKYRYAITFEGRDEYADIAQIDFATLCEAIEQQTGVKLRTIAKPKTGEQKFDSFTIILA